MRLITAATLLAVTASTLNIEKRNNSMNIFSTRSSRFFASAFQMNRSAISTRLSNQNKSNSIISSPIATHFFNPKAAAALFSTSSSDIEWTTDKVRSTFLQYFMDREHTNVPSSASAPLNDPTLLFTNAGMNQFKPIFLGQVDPSSPMATWRRAANSQKCIRAGGKHNDLEDVGKDTYHHTFFEMLGSWSFGDYFKEEAIEYAWTLLTEVYGIDKDRLYATYFEGDESLGLEPDLEARDYWLKYLPEDRVIASNVKDNFWEMGETGPCGPCTEIHYDRIGGRNAAHIVNQDDPNVLEIWNIVFIQYNRDEKGLSLLPAKHIDTGMGLERLVSVLQNKDSNYDIDAFQPIFDAIEKESKVGGYTGLLLDDDKTLKDTAFRAIADHARTLSFAIADGAVPSNAGRGYVLRRILRRAARYGQQILKADPGFFVKIIPSVVETFGDSYPELRKQQQTIMEIVAEEEAAFSSMLDRGITFFSDLKDEMKKEGLVKVPGDKAFYLYDTLGFPIDLTEQMAEEAGFTVDTQGFQDEMDAQKQRSRDARNAAKMAGGVRLELIAEQTSWLANNDVSITNDSYKYEWDIDLPTSITAIYTENGFLKSNEVAKTGDTVGLIVEKSSFYAEAGGQEADLGEIILMKEGNRVGKFNVLDVQVFGGYVLHSGVIEEGEFAVGSDVELKVDYDRRRDVAPNHSMTHVLNGALRQILGDDVEQRGSLCNDEKLRFDFSYKKALDSNQLRDIEALCQKSILDAEDVKSETMPLAQAKEIEGVRAVFGEVYPDPVRVVSVGKDISVEFCGGTHISNTKEAEAFVLIEETAVAKGIRRISAVTKGLAKKAIAEGTAFEKSVSEAESLSTDTDGLDKTAGSLRKEIDETFMSAVLKSELRARIEVIQKKAVEAKKRALAQRVDKVLNVVNDQVKSAAESGAKSLVLNVGIGADSKSSQTVMNAAKNLAPDMAFMGISEEDIGSGGKLMVFAVVPDALVEAGLKADEWVRNALEVCGGRGGGRPQNAQGQATECSDVDEVLAAAEKYASEKIGSMVL